MIFCFVRETKQLTLEEIDRKFSQHRVSRLQHLPRFPGSCLFHFFANVFPLAEVFMVPTRQYVGHEATVWLPYFIKRYIFFQNVVKPPPIIERAEKVDAVIEG